MNISLLRCTLSDLCIEKSPFYSLLQAEELLKRMASIDGNKSAVRDVAARQRIASFPSDLYDPDILSKLTGKNPFCWPMHFIGQLIL